MKNKTEILEANDNYFLFRTSTDPLELGHMLVNGTVYGKMPTLDCKNLSNKELSEYAIAQIGLNENAKGGVEGQQTPFTSFSYKPGGFGGSQNYICVVIPKNEVEICDPDDITKISKTSSDKQPLIVGEPLTYEILVPNNTKLAGCSGIHNNKEYTLPEYTLLHTEEALKKKWISDEVGEGLKKICNNIIEEVKSAEKNGENPNLNMVDLQESYKNIKDKHKLEKIAKEFKKEHRGIEIKLSSPKSHTNSSLPNNRSKEKQELNK